jgi:hypothetical protein
MVNAVVASAHRLPAGGHDYIALAAGRDRRRADHDLPVRVPELTPAGRHRRNRCERDMDPDRRGRGPVS